jgi:hypothetical protein
MSHLNPHVRSKAHEASRSMFDAMQGMAEIQIKIWRQVGDVQRKTFSDAVEAIQAQVQLIGKMNTPREFANVQAHLVKEYGQKYADSISATAEFVAQALQEYGDRFEELKSATDDMQEAVSIALQEGKERANGGKKAVASTKKAPWSGPTTRLPANPLRDYLCNIAVNSY